MTISSRAVQAVNLALMGNMDVQGKVKNLRISAGEISACAARIWRILIAPRKLQIRLPIVSLYTPSQTQCQGVLISG